MPPDELPLRVLQNAVASSGDDAAMLLEGAAPDAIYAHVPFCRHKCHYCDFYSLVDRRDRFDDFVR
ncbi:MAG: hypothetical protein CMJ51_04460, partial [Planctomycetaceae bacterium]|nr:hypothetical protein [Planctomycetaceae bacterium]